MTEAQAIEAIDRVFNSGWAAPSGAIAANPALPAAFVSGGIPFGFDDETEPVTDYFATCTVKHTTSVQITTGAVGERKVENRGYIMVKLWVPADTGRTNIGLLAGVARSLYAGVNIPSPVNGDEPIVVYPGATAEVGSDGRWFMEVVRFPFRYYGLM